MAEHVPNQRLRQFRQGLNLSQSEFAQRICEQGSKLGLNVACDEKRVGRWERGEVTWPSAPYRRIFVAAWGREPVALGFVAPSSHGTDRREVISGIVAGAGLPLASSVWERTDSLRLVLQEIVDSTSVNTETLDDLERAVLRHARSHPVTPPEQHLESVLVDLSLVTRLRGRRQPTRHQQRLSRTATQLAGLAGLDLAYLGATRAAESWFHTSYRYALDSGDQGLAVWAKAQAMFQPLHQGAAEEAILLADEAQNQASGLACPGAVLAAAGQSQAYASVGNRQAAEIAYAKASDLYERLPHELRALPVFGMTERRVHLYLGNALGRMGHHDKASSAHDIALAGYPAENYGARVLILLERANSLIRSGNLVDGCELAEQTLSELPVNKRTPLVFAKGREVFTAIPQEQRRLPAPRALGELTA